MTVIFLGNRIVILLFHLLSYQTNKTKVHVSLNRMGLMFEAPSSYHFIGRSFEIKTLGLHHSLSFILLKNTFTNILYWKLLFDRLNYLHYYSNQLVLFKKKSDSAIWCVSLQHRFDIFTTLSLCSLSGLVNSTTY